MHGGMWRDRGAGSLGDIGSFSFQMCKTMSSGEGGICITSNPELAERLFRIKHVGYPPGTYPTHAPYGPPPGLLCYNFRATAFHPLILHEQLKGLDALLECQGTAVRYLEGRLAACTNIHFQARGKAVTRQGYFGWYMLFDDAAYTDVNIGKLQAALEAEGLPISRPEGPSYNDLLFNLPTGEYRIDQPCTVTEHVCERGLWLLHPYLIMDHRVLEKIADAIEKVLNETGELAG